jgi:hypothetical protein
MASSGAIRRIEHVIHSVVMGAKRKPLVRPVPRQRTQSARIY